eukprot:CAMPEP_0201944070 /NCGR_PEP_ID=MMETSP0903-20130614/52405_1 /ASSEMBLY_ACC=CAM_ASM_000552 /TAXON_ID=420261 /ORGANISM="Thalassiosira antarctica, Strain CCMP982" /LENGTH=79 /DNA_ID=CAMNT_0048486967 /DNA_START=175 /DNA_END=411 /DNA_ORIENTATION=+
MIISVYCNTLGLNISKNQSIKSPPVKSLSSDPGPPPKGHAKKGICLAIRGHISGERTQIILGCPLLFWEGKFESSYAVS